MKPYLALIRIDLKLALRNKSVLFFNYLFPVIFFLVFAQFMGAALGGGIAYIVSMVLILGILGNGLFGAGVRAAQEREANILRRYKVTPISPTPILVASMITGWVVFIPTIVIVMAMAHFSYGMPIPDRWLSLFGLISLGVIAFRAIGLILASVANSMQESNILVQLLYMPMLFLSGATFPVSSLPEWARVVAQFLPASYLVTGFQGVFYREESLLDNGTSVLALAATVVLATFISTQLFRWEKEERIRSSAKLWVLGVLVPFFILGGYQVWSRDHLRKADVLWRELQRREVLLIRDARIFVGDGRVLDSAAVLIRDGSIVEVFDSERPDPARWNAEVIEAAGKTLLPGLIDVHVHLGAPGGLSVDPSVRFDLEKSMSRALAAYIYSGITAVRSAGDALEPIVDVREKADSGELLGAELFICGPMFTAEGGHGMGEFAELPDPFKRILAQQMLIAPRSEDEALLRVRELYAANVDAIKVVLGPGGTGRLLPRMDVSILRAIAKESAIHGLPLIARTASSGDVREAVDAGARGIERGTYRDPLPEGLIAQMVKKGVFYDPTLSLIEARIHIADGVEELLERSLTQQVSPLELLEKAREALRSTDPVNPFERIQLSGQLEQAKQNLLAAYRNGVTLVAGSDAGNPLVLHGPTIHRELELWVEAGVPEAHALRAATANAARYLGVEDRLGLVAKGYEANLLLVDGNPLKDITATQRISLVIYRGDRIRRSALFDTF